MENTQTTQNPDELLTPKEVAAILRVSPATVYRWLVAGRIKGKQIGIRTWRVRRGDLPA